METLPSPPDTKATPVTPAPWFRRPAALAAGVLLLLIAAAWWDGRVRIGAMQDETARRLADSDSRQQQERTLAQADREALLDAQNKIGVLEARLAETQSQAMALESMYQDIVRGRDERLLAEIEQSISIAAQQLQLAGNVEAALIALQTADARLAGSAQSRFVPLRRLIGRDIARLKALPSADLTGLTLKIESVMTAIDTLPLAFEHRPEPAAKAAPATPAAAAKPLPAATATPMPGIAYGVMEKLGSEIWQEVKQLIRIERIDHGDPALLAPSQSFFLRENLRLRLLSARLSLLQRESTTFRDDLRHVRQLLERYFDTRSKPVQTALATVAHLAETHPSLDLPSLGETLTAVRSLKLPREKAS